MAEFEQTDRIENHKSVQTPWKIIHSHIWTYRTGRFLPGEQSSRRRDEKKQNAISTDGAENSYSLSGYQIDKKWRGALYEKVLAKIFISKSS